MKALELINRKITARMLGLTLAFITPSIYAQINSSVAGNWNTAANWSPATVPLNTSTVNVNHSMVMNSNVAISTGIYTFNQSTSATGNTSTLSMTGGTLEIKNNSTVAFSGASPSLSGGSIIVRSGSVLTLGNDGGTINLSGVKITVEPGGVLNLTGNVTRSNTAAVKIDGTLNVTKTFTNTASDTLKVNGTANLNTSGSSTTDAIVSTAASFVMAGTGTVNATGRLNMSTTSTTSIDIRVNSTFSGNLFNTNSTPTVNVYSNVTFGGFGISNNGNIYVRSGGYLTYNSGYSTNAAGIKQYIEADATMKVNGNLSVTNGGTLQIDGTLIVNGNFLAQDSNVTGNGEFTSTGSMKSTNNYNIFGVNATLYPCNTGPCSGRSLCGRSASSSPSSSSVCSGSSATLTGTVTSGTPASYQWQSSATNTESGFSNVTGAILSTYSPAPVATTYYRVKITVSGCTSTSTVSTITISPSPAAIISYTGSPYCISLSSQPVTRTGTAGGTYSASPSGLSISSSNGFITPSSSSAGTYTVTYAIPAAGGCPAVNATASVIISNCLLTWTGSSSTAWNAAANWSPASVPTMQDSVVIPASAVRMPVVSGSVNAAGVKINSSATITLSSGSTLNTYGKFVNNGTFTTVSTSTLVFKGSSAQTVNGITSLYNMTVNNTNGVTVLSPLIIKGTLNLPSGVLATGNQVKIDIDNGGNIGYTAADAGSVSGTIMVYRAVSAVKTHYISCPLNSVTVNDLADDAEVINPSTNKTRLFKSNFTTQGWTAINDVNSSFVPGDAYSMYFPAATSIDFMGSYTHGAVYSSGSYANAAVNYIFMGNPYPTTLDWSNAAGWTKTKIKDAIYYWNPVTSGYASYVNGVSVNGGTQYVPAMNSFFVATDGTGGSSSLSINNTSRTSAQSPAFWRTAADQTVRLSLKGGSQNTDETVIRFNDLATVGFDNDLDAYKFMNTGSSSSIYTSINEINYSINSLSAAEAYPVIPVGLKLPADDTYTISVTSSDASLVYVLLDKVLGTETVINGSGIYSFNGSKTDQAARFELQLRTDLTTGIQNGQGNGGIMVSSVTGGFMVSSAAYAGPADLEILDITGRSMKVMNTFNLAPSGIFISLDGLSAGAYLVKVTAANQVSMQQISLIK